MTGFCAWVGASNTDLHPLKESSTAKPIALVIFFIEILTIIT